MQKKGSLDKIRAKYPGYYQKKSANWKKEKEIKDLALSKKTISPVKIKSIDNNIVAYFNVIDNMDENINKLFKLL
jgi:hypothetical protein